MRFSTSLKTHEKSTFIFTVFSWEFHEVHDSFEIFIGPEKCNFQGFFMAF